MAVEALYTGNNIMATATVFRADNFEYDRDGDWLGSGAFGDVYKCCLKNSGQQVAIKVLVTPKTLKSRYFNSQK